MGIRVGYRVERPDGALGIVIETRPLERGSEPCFARVRYADGTRDELLRDLISRPPTPSEPVPPGETVVQTDPLPGC